MSFGQNNYICFVKRIALITLLSLFLFNSIGYYFLFLIADTENRNEIQNASTHAISIQTIRVPKSEFKNLILRDDEKEISINGEMYDVQSVSTDGDYIIINGINDKKETELLTELNVYIKNNSDSNSQEKKQNNFSKNPIKDLFVSEKNNLTRNFSFILFPTENCKSQTVNLTLLAPPPRTTQS